MRKKVTVVLLLAISAGIIYGLSQQIVNSLQAGYRLDQAADELTRLQRQNTELKKRLDQTQSLSFIEEVTRDKLGLVKPGETLVIIPDKLLDRVLSAQKKIEVVKLPNWQGWLKLFFH